MGKVTNEPASTTKAGLRESDENEVTTNESTDSTDATATIDRTSGKTKAG